MNESEKGLSLPTQKKRYNCITEADFDENSLNTSKLYLTVRLSGSGE